ncbi:MAG: carbohydrate ABC transporter permease, partial [Pseudomonadota bacterium]
MLARPLTWPLALILVLAVALTLFPIFWIVMTAIKPPTDWNVSPAIWIPSEPTLINFQTLFDPTAIGAYGVGGVSESATAAVAGSLLASLIATAFSVGVGLFAAIGLSRYAVTGKYTPLMISEASSEPATAAVALSL